MTHDRVLSLFVQKEYNGRLNKFGPIIQLKPCTVEVPFSTKKLDNFKTEDQTHCSKERQKDNHGLEEAVQEESTERQHLELQTYHDIQLNDQ